MLGYIFYLIFTVFSLIMFRLLWEEMFGVVAVLCLIFLKEMYYEYEDFHIMGEHLGIDRMSFMMSLLSFYISLLVFGSSLTVYECFNKNNYMLILLFMLMGLFIMFISLDFLMFYIMFEVVLIPMYLLIMGWGYQPERLYAGNYLFFYTLFASLPLLVSLIYLDNIFGSLFIMYNFSFMKIDSMLIILMMISAFLVKLPMFMVHLWLPRAHVEAPISGSMLLAGVLLKMGGYGLIRMSVCYFGELMLLSSIMTSIGLFGGVLVSLLCLRQVDLKALIAYSSVVHMGFMMCGVFSFSYAGICGSVVLMMGHGLCSSGLFFLASVIYIRLFSRSIIINKGLMMFIPSMSLILFLLISSNMAAPPSLNLMGEVELIISVLSWHKMTWVLLMLMSFFSGAYCIYLFSVLSHGDKSNFMLSFQELKMEEYYILFLHWVPLNLLIMKSELFLMFLYNE